MAHTWPSIWSQQLKIKEYSSIWHAWLFREHFSNLRHLEANILWKQPKHDPNMAKTWPQYGPNEATLLNIFTRLVK